MNRFRPYQNKICWICEAIATSQEHKIKASTLRRVFGKEILSIGQLDGGRKKLAQGINSRYLKFSTYICEPCNSSRTQRADVAYDKFSKILQELSQNNQPLELVFSSEDFSPEGRCSLDLSRYFAKLLGCHLSGISAPIPVRLAEFVLAQSSEDCISLSVRNDPFYEKISSNYPEIDLRFAAHGGLVVITKKPDLAPVRIHSTQTIGNIQIVFDFAFTEDEIEELRREHSEFFQWCQKIARESDPISPDQLDELGLRNNEVRE